MATYMAKKTKLNRNWVTQMMSHWVCCLVVASILRGKQTDLQFPHVDTGDFVVIVIVDIALTGKSKPTRSTTVTLTPRWFEANHCW